MDSQNLMALIWLIVGVLLVAGELVIPGLVSVFLGGAALLVAAVVWLGLISGLPAALVVWAASSIFLVVALRGAAKKFLPAEYTRESTDEELAAYGTVVEVVEPCDDEELVGRIRYQGTTWPARALDGRIEAGQRAKLVARDKKGLGWIIERLGALDAADDDGGATA